MGKIFMVCHPTVPEAHMAETMVVDYYFWELSIIQAVQSVNFLLKQVRAAEDRIVVLSL